MANGPHIINMCDGDPSWWQRGEVVHQRALAVAQQGGGPVWRRRYDDETGRSRKRDGSWERQRVAAVTHGRGDALRRPAAA